MDLTSSGCSMFSHSSWVKDPFEMADVVDRPRLSITVCTQTESVIVDKGKMPHPSLNDGHPFPRVYQTSQGCYPSNWCFVEVYSGNYSIYIYICIYHNLPPKQYICSRSVSVHVLVCFVCPMTFRVYTVQHTVMTRWGRSKAIMEYKALSDTHTMRQRIYRHVTSERSMKSEANA